MHKRSWKRKGRDNECLTKSEILAKGGENVRVEGSYGNGECVMLDNVLANVITWEYTFSVTPTSLSFDAICGTRQVSVTSYKRKYLNGSYTGQQVDVGFSSSASGTGFSSVGTSVSANENTSIYNYSGSIVFSQKESGKTVKVGINQESYYGTYVGGRATYLDDELQENISNSIVEVYYSNGTRFEFKDVPFWGGTYNFQISVTIKGTDMVLDSVDSPLVIDGVSSFEGKISGSVMIVQTDLYFMFGTIRIVYAGSKL